MRQNKTAETKVQYFHLNFCKEVTLILAPMATHFLLCLLFSSGMLANIKATIQKDWENKYEVEQSWEGQNFRGDANKPFPDHEDDVSDQLFALREQPVKNIRVKRDTVDYFASGSAPGFSPLVICRRDNFTVVLRRKELSSRGFDNATLHLADSSCKTSHNETHVYITSALHECGTTYSETDKEMFYNNTLTGKILTSPDSIITRGKSFAYSFKCAYDRVFSLTGLKFEPPKQELVIEKSDIGNFTVNMGSYSDSGFLSPSSEQYPAFKSFSERINIEYGVDTQNPDIVVRAESCRATPSIQPYDTPQYEFISEGCDKDETIIHVTSGLQNRHRFSIQVFRFIANHTFVYIHCDIRICNRNSPDSICAKSTSCSNRRKRRDVPATDRTYQLAIGPIVYREKQPEKETEKVQESGLNTTMIAILAVAAVIVILLSLTVVILVRRRRGGNHRTSLEKIPMKCPAGKVEDFTFSNLEMK
ncbi:ZP domain-containing protein-like [Dendronephthya gigantea]|uniref:ZP domain-containing protein-like n=1 Tax=Dendronephthya gigantea TaxID=151771 RepID=UPI00106ABF9D|nr:ZP domain-containing protein-like [Dendronephthya gigantea]